MIRGGPRGSAQVPHGQVPVNSQGEPGTGKLVTIADKDMEQKHTRMGRTESPNKETNILHQTEVGGRGRAGGKDWEKERSAGSRR